MSDTPRTDNSRTDAFPDTPRTNAFADAHTRDDHLLFAVRCEEFARQLERELAEAKLQADKWANLAAASESVAVKTHLEAEKAREELEDAKRDAQRYRTLKEKVVSGSLGFGDSWIDYHDLKTGEADEYLDKLARGA